MKDKKACIFYFLMTLIFLDFGNQLKILSENEYFKNINNPVFSIVNLNNTGGAFGLFLGGASFLAVLGIIVVVFLSIYVYKNIKFSDKLPLLAITLFCAGALGNIIERIKYGYVVDYIKLNFVDFAVFNSFDIMICTSVFIYFLFIIFNKDFKGQNEN